MLVLMLVVWVQVEITVYGQFKVNSNYWSQTLWCRKKVCIIYVLIVWMRWRKKGTADICYFFLLLSLRFAPPIVDQLRQNHIISSHLIAIIEFAIFLFCCCRFFFFHFGLRCKAICIQQNCVKLHSIYISCTNQASERASDGLLCLSASLHFFPWDCRNENICAHRVNFQLNIY